MNEITRMDLKSQNITEEQKAKLRQLFPEVFNEDKIDFEKLRMTLGDDVDTGEERYGMTWPGKAECFKIIQQPSIATLKPCPEESVNWDTTQNLFIEGDNLEVLKLLQKSYYGKVKMIYIDPPYNTGKEFIYPDKYSESLDTYLAYTGQVDDQGYKFSTNTETEGRFHSKWLNMMYPRLFLARNLLRDDGVLFISIDDNEVKNLRDICDEIFGEDNFLSKIIIQSNKRGQTYKDIAKCHEYLLVYYKSEDSFLGELEKEDNSLPFKDEKGEYDLWELRNRNPRFGKHNRPNLYYPIYVNPNSRNEENLYQISLQKTDIFTIEVFPKNSSGEDSCWRWGKEKVWKDGIQANPSTVYAKSKRDGGWNIYEKSRKNTTKAKSIWADTKVISEQGTVEAGKLNMSGLLDFPKPLELIKRCVQLSSNESDIILDFFAGSSTTAHAVMKLNSEDKGKRKFIMVQLPELCGEQSAALKAGYKNIADIGKERIRRVIKAIVDKHTEFKEQTKLFNGETTNQEDQDLGFKVFKLDGSNFKVWEGDVEKKSLEKQIEMHLDHIRTGSNEYDLLYEILLKAGFEVTVPIEKLELFGKKVYSVAEGALLICLDKEITTELIRAIAEREPARVVCLDQGFNGNDQLKTNAVQIMKSFKVNSFHTV